jgi:unspecific monooxygenase
LFLKPLHLNLGRFTPWGRAILNRERLVRYIAAQIEWQRQSPCEDGSILAHIVQKSEAETLSVEQICAELLALLIFGHETGAAAIAWAFAHIYQRPDVLAGIKQEAFSGGEVQPYLEACINESMRLCPVVVQLIRVAEKDLVLANHAIKTGETVIPCTYLAHHNPDVFPRPERFVPERFMNGARYPYSFFPFGFGARTCIGKPFMLRQMPLIVSTIIQSTELALAPGYEPRPVRQMVLIVPKGGTLMVRRG